MEEIITDAEGNESITVISNHRFIYRGYLQIACCDLTRTAHPCLWLITWDPTQPVATRPLAIQKDGTWFCYGWDLTKNICEVFGQNGYIRTAYSYTPYGSVTANGDITQPIQWSSEYADTDLALVYYNYRHYNPMDGRWLGRDLVEEYRQSLSRYSYTDNNSVWRIDNLGNSWFSDAIDWVVEEVSHVAKVTMDTFNKIEVHPRIYHSSMLLLGVLEGMAGAALLSIPEPTMATKIIGGMLLIQGSDIITTSVMAIYDGERRDSIIHRATKATAMEVGISEQKAELLAKTVNVGIGVVGMRAPLCAKGVGFMKECPKKVITEINNAETKFVPISRWGGELKNGSWVMKGYPTVGNYALSGKNQPTWLIGNNIYTPPNHVKTYLVPKNSLHCPKGREGVKYIFGQRIYKSKK